MRLLFGALFLSLQVQSSSGVGTNYGGVNLNRFYDSAAPVPKPYATFLLGSQEQHLFLALDFTTAGAWVVPRKCGNALCAYGKAGFDPSNSTSFKNSSLPFSGSFYTELAAQRKVSGHVGIDRMQLFTWPPSENKWTSVFGMVSTADLNVPLGAWNPDGVVGLAPRDPSGSVDPVLPHLFSSGSAQTLTVRMKELNEPPYGDMIYVGFYPGSFDFGGDGHCVQDTYFFTPTTEEGTWRFALGGVQLANVSRTAREVVEVDAQSMLTGVPPSFYKQVVSATGAKAGSGALLEVDCSKTFSRFVLTIGGRKLSVSQEVYISKDKSSGKCRLLLYPLSVGGFGPAWRLGFLWFYEVCFHFNVDSKSVGFSNQMWNS